MIVKALCFSGTILSLFFSANLLAKKKERFFWDRYEEVNKKLRFCSPQVRLSEVKDYEKEKLTALVSRSLSERKSEPNHLKAFKLGEEVKKRGNRYETVIRQKHLSGLEKQAQKSFREQARSLFEGLLRVYLRNLDCKNFDILLKAMENAGIPLFDINSEDQIEFLLLEEVLVKVKESDGGFLAFRNSLFQHLSWYFFFDQKSFNKVISFIAWFVEDNRYLTNAAKYKEGWKHCFQRKNQFTWTPALLLVVKGDYESLRLILELDPGSILSQRDALQRNIFHLLLVSPDIQKLGNISNSDDVNSFSSNSFEEKALEVVNLILSNESISRREKIQSLNKESIIKFTPLTLAKKSSFNRIYEAMKNYLISQDAWDVSSEGSVKGPIENRFNDSFEHCSNNRFNDF